MKWTLTDASDHTPKLTQEFFTNVNVRAKTIKRKRKPKRLDLELAGRQNFPRRSTKSTKHRKSNHGLLLIETYKKRKNIHSMCIQQRTGIQITF